MLGRSGVKKNRQCDAFGYYLFFILSLKKILYHFKHNRVVINK